MSNLIVLCFLVTGMSFVNADSDAAKNEITVSSGGAMVYCENTGATVYAKNANVRYAPGGLTKMVTALVAAQTLSMDKEIKISKNAASRGGTLLELRENEVVTAKDLICATLIFGSDAAAYALAENTFGSVDEFIGKMNKTVRNIDCRRTKFKNVTGDNARGQYTTAKDYMQILRVALSNRTIREISQKNTHRFSMTNKHKARTLSRKGITAGGDEKLSGYAGTEAAQDRQSAVQSGDNGMQLFIVLLEASQQQRQDDLLKLAKYAGSRVDGYRVVKKGKRLGKVRVKHGEKTEIGAYSASDGYAYLPKEGSKKLIKTGSIMYGNVKAPVKKGQVVGHCNIYVGDEVTHKVPLLAEESVGEGWFPSYFGISNFATIVILIATIILASFLMAVVILRAKAKRQRERRRKRRIRRILEQQLREEEGRRRRNRGY